MIYALILSIYTGWFYKWEHWYSASLEYRFQTDALFKGNLAVSDRIDDLKFDHTWSEQGVHQVWGLGIPIL